MLTTKQYEPYYLASNLTSTRNETSDQNVTAGGGVTRNLTNDEANRTGSQNITAVQNSTPGG